MPKLLTFKQILEKRFKPLNFLSDEVKNCFGELVHPFQIMIWGESGNGKTNLVMQLIRSLAQNGPVLYLSLEEGHGVTMQKTLARQLDGCDLAHGLRIAGSDMTYDGLVKVISRRRSAQFIIIDSIQYFDITYEQYKELKTRFKKSLIFISHAKNKKPHGTIPNKIRYDVDVKVHVEGYVAFVQTRFGGNEPYLIWEEGARRYWGKQFKKIILPKKA